MSEGLIPVPIYVSPFQPIRLALGKMGYPASYVQTLKDDFVAWVIEAQDKVSRKHTYVPLDIDGVEQNNKIEHCCKMIECVGDQCAPFTYQASGSCPGVCTNNCSKICCGNPQSFIVDECYIHFTPPIADGVPIKVKGYGRKYD